MFSTLSSYIWASEPDEQIVPDDIVEFEERLAESEWVLVDVVNHTSTKSATQKDAVENEQEASKAVPHFAECLEESWYITPPSCFNASQPHSSILETSPLENLLIEHPSMSVYGPTETRLEDSTVVAEQTLENSRNESVQAVVERRPSHEHRRVLRVVDKIELFKRRVQKSVLEQTKRQLRNKKIERHNKTQKHMPHSRRKQKQIDRKLGKHSGVHSNRGC